jgi:hypothetical protein
LTISIRFSARANAPGLSMGFLREDEVSGVTRLLDDVKFKDRDFGSTFCAGTVMMPNHTSLLTPLAFMNT